MSIQAITDAWYTLVVSFLNIIIADLQLFFNNLQVGFYFLWNFLVFFFSFAGIEIEPCKTRLEIEQMG